MAKIDITISRNNKGNKKLLTENHHSKESFYSFQFSISQTSS